MGLALAMVVAGAACKKVDGAQGSSGGAGGSALRGGAAGSGSAAPAVAPPVVAAWHVPAGARKSDANVDASALGTSVRAHLIERTDKLVDNGARYVKTLLVLEGNGAIIADITDEELAQDASPKLKDLPADTDLPLPPLAPPRPFAADDSMQPLDYTGPLLFLVHFVSKGEKRDLAIAQAPDGLGVWTMIAASDSVDVAPTWERTGTIKLAPSATVTAPADAAGPAPAPAFAPAAATPSATGGGAALVSALDDALKAKGIAADQIAQRASGPHSQWVALKGTPHALNMLPVAYAIWRASAAGVVAVTLAPPPTSPANVWFDELTSIEIKDVDGNGIDDAVISAKWSRQLTGKSKRGKLVTTEEVTALYVVGGVSFAVGAKHATHYATETNLGDGENPQPAESIAFAVSIKPGSPPRLHAEVGEQTVSKSRAKGLLDPAHDPWLVAGDQPITFRGP